ncbi:MAG: T9SS type A sorting domain-containing protein [Bacteroidales bacterium]
MKKIFTLTTVLLLLCFLSKISQAQTLIANAGLNQVICLGQSVQLGGSPTASGGTAPYTYSWNPASGLNYNTVANPTASPLSTTAYAVTVTDNVMNTDADTVFVTVNPLPVANAGNDLIICYGQSAYLTGTGGASYAWSTGQNTPSITVTPTSTTIYTVTVTNAGCTASDNVTINVSPPPVANAGNDQTICNGQSATLTASGGSTYQWSNGANTQTITVSPSVTTTYTVSATNTNGCSGSDAVTIYVTNCQDTITGKVFIDSNNDGIQNNVEQGAYNMMVNIMPTNNYTFTDINGNYKFPAPTGTHTISVPNIPVYSTITPATHTANFTTPGQIDSLNDFALYQLPNVKELAVSLTAATAPKPGFQSYFYINYKNNGSVAMNGIIELIFDNHYNYLSCSPAYTSISNDTITWNFYNLLPCTSGNIQANFLLPSSITIGTQLQSTITINPVAGDTLPSNNTDTLAETVVGSFDPNEKSVAPSEPLTIAQITNADPLTYIIRFQNTGTAPAIFVTVKDTLNENLNIGSFEMVAASHSYSMQMYGTGILEWKFDSIMLPDSSSNEALSHGFVKYRIKPKTSLTNSDTIKNTAYIYFDYNTPVMTNTAVSYLEDINTLLEEQENELIKIYPNPTNDEITIVFDKETGFNNTFEVCDLLGNIVLSKSILAKNKQVTISISQLSAGVYFYKINSEKNFISSGKIIIQ